MKLAETKPRAGFVLSVIGWDSMRKSRPRDVQAWSPWGRTRLRADRRWEHTHLPPLIWWQGQPADSWRVWFRHWSSSWGLDSLERPAHKVRKTPTWFWHFLPSSFSIIIVLNVKFIIQISVDRLTSPHKFLSSSRAFPTVAHHGSPWSPISVVGPGALRGAAERTSRLAGLGVQVLLLYLDAAVCSVGLFCCLCLAVCYFFLCSSSHCWIRFKIQGY